MLADANVLEDGIYELRDLVALGALVQLSLWRRVQSILYRTLKPEPKFFGSLAADRRHEVPSVLFLRVVVPVLSTRYAPRMQFEFLSHSDPEA